jgi:hypothetical protein
VAKLIGRIGGNLRFPRTPAAFPTPVVTVEGAAPCVVEELAAFANDASAGAVAPPDAAALSCKEKRRREQSKICQQN